MNAPLLVIPARLASTRLPRKALAEIGGVPLAVRAALAVARADLGRALMAVDSPELVDAARAYGLEATLTPPDLPSGSDRVWRAVEAVDPRRAHAIVVNVQGDLPFRAGEAARAALAALDDDMDVGTAVGPCAAADVADEARVKAVVDWRSARAGFACGVALWFSRAPTPWGAGAYWEHVGVYAWRRAALARFVAAKPTALERREGLEQLRALALGLRFGVARVDAPPMGVDTPQDLARARALFAAGAET